ALHVSRLALRNHSSKSCLMAKVRYQRSAIHSCPIVACLLNGEFSATVPATCGKLRFEFDGRGEGQKPGRIRVSPGGAGSGRVAHPGDGSKSALPKSESPRTNH